MDREDIGGIEVAETSTAPVDRVLHREISHEAAAVLNPGIVIVPEEEIDNLLVALL